MFLYILLAIIILIPVFVKSTRGWHNFIVFLLCFFGFFRGRTVGTDVDIYCRNIVRTTFDPQSWNFYTVFEPGYNILIAIYNAFFNNPLFFIGLCSVFFILSYNYYLKCKNEYASIGLFILYMLGYYLQSYNIIRQYFALSIMLLLLSKYDLDRLKKKELLFICILIILVGTLFHNAIYILLCIPIYHIIKDTWLNKKTWYYVVVIASYVIFYLDIVRIFLGRYNFFLINEKTNNYYSAALESTDSDYSMLRILLDTLFCIYIIFKTKRIDAYLFLMVVAQVFTNLFASLNPLFVRIPVILYIISIPLLVQIWVFGQKTKPILISYFLIIFINTLIKNYGMVQPYVFNF